MFNYCCTDTCKPILNEAYFNPNQSSYRFHAPSTTVMSSLTTSQARQKIHTRPSLIIEEFCQSTPSHLQQICSYETPFKKIEMMELQLAGSTTNSKYQIFKPYTPIGVLTNFDQNRTVQKPKLGCKNHFSSPKKKPNVRRALKW